MRASILYALQMHGNVHLQSQLQQVTLVQLLAQADAAGKLWPRRLSILLKTEGLLAQ